MRYADSSIRSILYFKTYRMLYTEVFAVLDIASERFRDILADLFPITVKAYDLYINLADRLVRYLFSDAPG